ncbi:MAG: hypothetical protein ACYTA3_14565 [Planctomycetota bacterium]
MRLRCTNSSAASALRFASRYWARVDAGDELGLGGRQLPLGLEQLELDVGIAQLEQDRGRLHPGARIEVAALHTTGRDGGHPADLLGNERAGAAHLAQHGAALHDVDEHGGAIHRGGSRLDPEHGDRHERNGREGSGAVHVFPLPLARRAWNVQAAPSFLVPPGPTAWRSGSFRSAWA